MFKFYANYGDKDFERNRWFVSRSWNEKEWKYNDVEITEEQFVSLFNTYHYVFYSGSNGLDLVVFDELAFRFADLEILDESEAPCFLIARSYKNAKESK